jgi:tetratricopeptide (TPR) repeat protein
MLRKRLAIVGLAGGLVLAAALEGRAHAEGSQAEADALFAQGRDLLEKGNLGEACKKLQRSEEMAPAVGTLLNLGYCWEQLGRFRSAMEAYAEAEVLAGKTGDAKRSAFAKERLTAVMPKVLKVIVLVTPPAAPDLEVRRNGAVVPKTDYGQAIAVDPDEIVVTATAPGRVPYKSVVMGRGEGTILTVFVPPLETEGAVASGGRGGGSALGLRRYAALGLGAAAALAIGAGAGTALSAKSRHDDSEHHCDPSGCDEQGLEIQRGAVAQGNVATALFGLGILFAGAGTYLWIVGGDDKGPSAQRGVRWTAGVSPTGAALGGRF